MQIEMGRPRKRSDDEILPLSFKVAPDLVAALDAEAAKQTAELPPGRAKVSRTDVIRQALYEWLASRPAKPKRSK